MKSKLRKFLKIQSLLLAAVIFAGVLSVAVFAYNCSRVRNDVLRMHVIANSDSDEDQSLKLKVRDAVLERGAELFDGTVTAQDAKERIEPKKEELAEAAREVIEEEGYDYPVSVDVVNEYFATRCYGDLTMPAGRYTAVKVVIGEGAGHNWWCVMFPPLCLPAAQGRESDIDAFLDEDELKVVQSSNKYEPRFKIVEIIERLREKAAE
ncbi:MAG: stage II sporulation protein R [Acutalibacteraceae bacterium]